MAEFNRPPRIQETIEPREIVIPAPKPLPTKPKMNWLVVTIPLVATLLGVGLMVAFMGSSGGLSILFFLPMVIASAVVSVVTYFQEKKQYETAFVEEKASYQEVLDHKQAELAQIVSDQEGILRRVDPDIDTCFEWGRQAHPRLGERRPTDADYLSFRIGTGIRPAYMDIKPPSEDGRDKVYAQQYEQADALKPDFSRLKSVPIPTSLLAVGCVGLAGPRERTRAAARSAIVQLTTHHWPQEVNILVLCDSASVAGDWRWISELPHRTGLNMPAVVDVYSAPKKIIATLEQELHRRESSLYLSKGAVQDDKKSPMVPSLVVVLEHVESIYDQPAFATILKTGKALGAYALVLTDRLEGVPGECGAVIDCNAEALVYKETGPGKKPVANIKADGCTAEEAEQFAVSLHAIDWLIPANSTEPPKQVGLLEMYGVTDPDDLDIEKWWDGEYRDRYLRAPIGRKTATADLVFDLNESGSGTEVTHGPHGVIGGMTGSGKSELLRTIILSLAITHHPYDVNFALIDYKGGGAFKDLETLPHVTGIITDIENHANYAGRVIQALTGEINLRKQILLSTQLNAGLDRPHVDDYRVLPVKRPLPRLVIIFDEFAEFKDQHPDESRKLINIARQGRSLGVHLILCTQNPATAIDAQVKQNSKFKISLGVNSPDDSQELIGIPDAFGLQNGRAYMFVTSPEKFQSAFAGTKLASGRFAGMTEAQAIVKKLNEVNRTLGVQLPPDVWPEPLPERLYLPDLLKGMQESGVATSWDGSQWTASGRAVDVGYILGRFDDPEQQRQPLYSFGVAGSNPHLLVFGPSKSGKSTLLLTLAIGIARSHYPSQAQVYSLELSGQSLLHRLQGLPHAAREGGVIPANDRERIGNLLAKLRRTIYDRRQLFQQARCADWQSYNQNASSLDFLPAIYLFVDGLTSQFTDSYDTFNDQLAEIILDGSSVGIGVVITAHIAQDVYHKVLSYIGNRIVLRPADKNDVDNVMEVGSNKLIDAMLSARIPPGRGLLAASTPLELQVALPAYGATDDEQVYWMERTIASMAAAWEDGPRPEDIPVMPRYLVLPQLRAAVAQLPAVSATSTPRVAIGFSRPPLRPLGLSLEEHSHGFLIVSAAPGQGKTTLLETWAIELTRNYSLSQLKLIVIDFHSHALRRLNALPHIQSGEYVSQPNQLKPTLARLQQELVRRQIAYRKLAEKDGAKFNPRIFFDKEGYVVLLIDDYNMFRLKCGDEEKDLLKECIVHGSENGLRTILAETAAPLGYPNGDETLMAVTQGSSGIALGSPDLLDTYFNQAKLISGEVTADFPPGRGYIISQGHGRLIQVATFCPQGADPETALNAEIDAIAASCPAPKVKA